MALAGKPDGEPASAAVSGVSKQQRCAEAQLRGVRDHCVLPARQHRMLAQPALSGTTCRLVASSLNALLSGAGIHVGIRWKPNPPFNASSVLMSGVLDGALLMQHLKILRGAQ